MCRLTTTTLFLPPTIIVISTTKRARGTKGATRIPPRGNQKAITTTRKRRRSTETSRAMQIRGMTTTRSEGSNPIAVRLGLKSLRAILQLKRRATTLITKTQGVASLSKSRTKATFRWADNARPAVRDLLLLQPAGSSLVFFV